MASAESFLTCIFDAVEIAALTSTPELPDMRETGRGAEVDVTLIEPEEPHAEKPMG